MNFSVVISKLFVLELENSLNQTLIRSTTSLPSPPVRTHIAHVFIYRLQHSQVVPQQTERHPRGNLVSTHLQRCWHQAQRGLGKNEEDQMPQRSQTPLGLQGQRSEDQVNWQNRQNPRSRQKEVSSLAIRSRAHPSASSSFHVCLRSITLLL